MPIILSLYALLVAALTFAEFRRKRGAQAILKPLAALGFILIALWASAQDWAFGQWILAGLIACAAGDVLLLSRDNPLLFKLGMAAFAIGHVLYTIAFFQHPAFAFSPAIYALAVMPVLAGLAHFLWIRKKLPADFKIPVAVYTLIIITMVIASFGVPLWMIPVAAILFAVSDMFVARDRFVDDTPANALAITPLYFGAQALFALASFFPAKNVIQTQAAIAPPSKDGCPLDAAQLLACKVDSDCRLYEWVRGWPKVVHKTYAHCVSDGSEIEGFTDGITYGGDYSLVKVTCEAQKCSAYDPWEWDQRDKATRQR